MGSVFLTKKKKKKKVRLYGDFIENKIIGISRRENCLFFRFWDLFSGIFNALYDNPIYFEKIKQIFIM